MDADQVRQLGPRLGQFLARFDDCFPRSDTRAHLTTCVRGLLSDLPRKSVEPIALEAEAPPRALQQSLSPLDWDHDRLRDRTQQIVARDHACPHSVGILDDTGCPKKGDKAPGVHRQYCGASGKIDNCVITVHLACAADDFHCLLDSGLYLPESWDGDRPRCRAAGIPDTVVYRPEWEIALELWQRARGNGVTFSGLTFGEGCGGKPELLRRLHKGGQRFVAAVPATFTGWLRPPRPGRTLRPARPARAVADLARDSKALRDQPWVAYRVKDGQKGPMVREVKEARLCAKTEDGDPAWPWRLVVARNALDRAEVKYFVSNAEASVSVTQALLAAFTRWREERCFEDEKAEPGFDHCEGRSYQGLLRHQRLTALAHLLCGREKERLRGEKPGGDGVPGARGGERAGAVVVDGPVRVGPAAGAHGGEDSVRTAEERRGAGQPREANAAQAA